MCHPKQQSLCAKVLINAKQALQRVLSRLGHMHGPLQCIHLSMGCTNSVFRPLLIKATCAVGLALACLTTDLQGNCGLSAELSYGGTIRQWSTDDLAAPMEGLQGWWSCLALRGRGCSGLHGQPH